MRLNPSPLPQAGEGDSPAASGERGVENSREAEAPAPALEQAEAPAVSEVERGVAEMSKRFHDEGGEIYVPAE